MDLVNLTETIIKKLVTDPESVSVKEFETEEENTIQIEVLISADDMGRIIGKEGRIIRSIREIIYAYAAKEGKKVSVDVEEQKENA